MPIDRHTLRYAWQAHDWYNDAQQCRTELGKRNSLKLARTRVRWVRTDQERRAYKKQREQNEGKQ